MLQARRLEKIVDNRSVLSIEQLDLTAGEMVAVVGPPHSGKTLLVRILSGEVPPSGGNVMLDNQDLYVQASARKQIGTLFAEDLLYERLSVRHNLDFYRRLYNQPASRVEEVLTLMGLNDQARQSVSRLAPSVQRRLAFARLLLYRHSIYLLDQPALRCDPPTLELFARQLVRLAEEGAAVLATAEDLAWLGKFCTRIVEIQDGRIVNSHLRAAEQSTPPDVPAPVVPERHTPFRVPARKEDRILLFDPGDILYATSRDGKTIVRTLTEEATSNLTLQELEARLLGRGFFKAHRAYLVNLQHIKSMIQYTRNSYTLQLDDPQETMVPLSKQCEKELQELLGY